MGLVCQRLLLVIQPHTVATSRAGTCMIPFLCMATFDMQILVATCHLLLFLSFHHPQFLKIIFLNSSLQIIFQILFFSNNFISLIFFHPQCFFVQVPKIRFLIKFGRHFLFGEPLSIFFMILKRFKINMNLNSVILNNGIYGINSCKNKRVLVGALHQRIFFKIKINLNEL